MSLPKQRKTGVKGMTSPVCERKIEAALLALPGVNSARADLGEGCVHLEYDLLRVCLKEAEQTITGLGYELAGGFLTRLRRGLVHDAEENERANHLAGPALCCSKKAEQIVNSTRRVRSSRA